jgi:hypothetical protein
MYRERFGQHIIRPLGRLPHDREVDLALRKRVDDLVPVAFSKGDIDAGIAHLKTREHARNKVFSGRDKTDLRSGTQHDALYHPSCSVCPQHTRQTPLSSW